MLVCVLEGLYTVDETLAAFKAGLDDPRAAEGTFVIIDITRSESVKTPDDFRRVIGTLNRHPKFGGRIAVVPTAEDPLRWGLARQFAALTTLDGVPMEVCRSISDALSWLARDHGPRADETTSD